MSTVYSQKMTLTDANTGYSIAELLNLGTLDIKTAIHLRITGSANQAWVMPDGGSYAQTGGVPDDNGGYADIEVSASLPLIPLDKIYVGSSVADKKLSIFAITAVV
jgi:hypothetical protein